MSETGADNTHGLDDSAAGAGDDLFDEVVEGLLGITPRRESTVEVCWFKDTEGDDTALDKQIGEDDMISGDMKMAGLAPWDSRCYS